MWQKEVREYLKSKMTPRQRQLLVWVKWDLYEGGVNDEEYPGFTSACDELKDMEIPTLYYCGDSGEVADSNPDTQEYPEEWREIDIRSLKQALFGVAAEYI